jgi:hypothetical protein
LAYAEGNQTTPDLRCDFAYFSECYVVPSAVCFVAISNEVGVALNSEAEHVGHRA